MNGYGFYVWPSFAFFLVSCLYLYIKTKYELERHEKILSLENKVVKVNKIEFIKRKKSTEEVLSIN